MLLNCTLKNIKMAKFCYAYFATVNNKDKKTRKAEIFLDPVLSYLDFAGPIMRSLHVSTKGRVCFWI